MSNETQEGVQEVKTAACDKLLQARVDARMAGKKVGAIYLGLMMRVHVHSSCVPERCGVCLPQPQPHHGPARRRVCVDDSLLRLCLPRHAT